MTQDEVRAAVAAISIYAEGEAHRAEDALHQDVIRAIADGAEDAAALARLALTTLDLDFARWYE